MKRRLRAWVVALVVIVVVVVGAFFLFSAQRSSVHSPRNAVYDSADYCFDESKEGFSYHGVPSKRCICNGELLSDCPSDSFCIHTGEIRCNGLVVGTEYVVEGKTFRTLGDYESYCVNGATAKELCLQKFNAAYNAETVAS